MDALRLALFAAASVGLIVLASGQSQPQEVKLQQRQRQDSVYNFVRDKKAAGAEEVPEKTNGSSSHDGARSMQEMMKCFSNWDLSCALDNAEHILKEKNRRLMVEADNDVRGRKDSSSQPSLIMDTISALMAEISDILFTKEPRESRDGKEKSASAKKDKKKDAEDEEDDEYDDDYEEDEEYDEEEAKSNLTEAEKQALKELKSQGGDLTIIRGAKSGFGDFPLDTGRSMEPRGKKKKKKRREKFRKLKKLIKTIIGSIVGYFVLTLLLKLLAAHLQKKFLLIAGLGLAINAARFYLELKKNKEQEKQKVIYYSHAQHNHHYDNEDEWTEPQQHEGTEGWLRRILKKKKEADDDELLYSSGQNLAYAAQKPGVGGVSGLFTRQDDESGSSGLLW